jgi:TolA-binding protein
MWRAHKGAQAIYKNPKGTPPFQLARAQDGYRGIIKKYPDSLFAVQSQFSIGHLYLVVGDFTQARAEYKKLATDCDKKGNLCAEADYAIGNSFELEGKWNEALAFYRKIMRSYPLSAKSLDLPIYIIRHYARVKDEGNVRLFVDEANAYYLDLKAKSQTDKGDYILQSLIVRVFMEAGYWQDAVDALSKLVRDYPQQNPAESYLLKALIYNNRLKDKEKAKEDLQKIITLQPKSKLARQAEVFLKKIQ